jgi:SAM-dependent methyltransferase
VITEITGHPTGSALDIGCGMGADAVWLAGQGWQVTGVDVSPVALSRAAEHAADARVQDRTSWAAHDLKQGFPDGSFDLVCAQYLHSRQDRPDEREPILRSAAAAVAPGGCLLIIGHAGFPDGAEHHNADLPSTEHTLASLELDSTDWSEPRQLLVEQQRPGPDGKTLHYTDNVLRIRRVRAGDAR